MVWRAGDGGSGGGRWRSALGRVFGDGQNPLSWALPLYSAWGIRVRIHIFFILIILFELLGAMVMNRAGLAFIAPVMFGLFLMVLLHEYGHCIACRAVGGEADEILMWPLGGLAYCRPPHDWRSDLWTTLGGPAVNVVLAAPLGGLVLLLGGGWDALMFNPFEPMAVMSGLGGSYWLVIAWSMYFTNAILLAFNVLLPMYPMDGGRILHALLWARMGHARATRIAVSVGLGIAIAVALFSFVTGQTRLLGVAVFGAVTCWMERKRLEMMGGMEDEAWRGGGGGAAAGAGAAERERRRRAKEAERERAEQAEVDRLLDKIRDHGMQSLSGKERKFLERATKRRRGA